MQKISSSTQQTFENLIFDLSEFNCIVIAGKDAKKLLQGQLTCDIETISANTLQLAAHCNPQGRIISLFQIFFYNDAYYLLLPRNMVTIAIMALKKYAVFYKTEISELNETIKVVGFVGDVLKLNMNAFAFPQTSNRYLIVGLTKDINALMSSSVKTESSLRWRYLNICDGIPGIYPETSGKFLPHEINLPHLGGVSFDKGCYTGQEIIARMHYRAKIKNRFYKAELVSSFKITLGENIYYQDGTELKPIGYIVDLEKGEYNKYMSLIVIDDQYSKLPLKLINKETVITVLD